MIKYYATDATGNAIYRNPESNIFYRFAPGELEEANFHNDWSLLARYKEHAISKEDIY